MNKHNNYVVLTTALVVVVSLFVSVYFVVTIINASKAKDNIKIDKTISMPCSDNQATTIISDTTVALDPAQPEKIENLGPIADTILSYEQYEEDVVCLQILTTRYVYISDYSSAKKYLDLLNEKLKENTTKKLYRNFVSVEELNKNVDFLSRKIEEIERNNPYGSAI